MKIAFYLNLSDTPKTNIENPELGTVGTGAADYLLGLTAFVLKGAFEVVLMIEGSPIKRPKWAKTYNVESGKHAVNLAAQIGCQFFIYRLRQTGKDGIIEALERADILGIGRADLNPHPNHLNKLARCKNFAAMVCVGRYQFDQFLDHPISTKSFQINNFLPLQSCFNEAKKNVTEAKTVSYLGALVPQKSFHILAQAWPLVIKRHPDAKLNVLGSTSVYTDRFFPGPLGIADEAYEKEKIIPYLTDENGKILDSVNFLGNVSSEKYNILAQSTVGVVNPLGATETCCVSAFEFLACGTPVVSGRYTALWYTVPHKKCGLLGRGVHQLANNICTLLEKKNLADLYGKNGVKYSKQYFSVEVCALRWERLIKYLSNNGPKPLPQFKRAAGWRPFEILSQINATLQHSLGKIVPWPSIETLRYQLARASAKIKRFFHL